MFLLLSHIVSNHSRRLFRRRHRYFRPPSPLRHATRQPFSILMPPLICQPPGHFRYFRHHCRRCATVFRFRCHAAAFAADPPPITLTLMMNITFTSLRHVFNIDDVDIILLLRKMPLRH